MTPTNLIVAYVATWVIHIGYFTFLGFKARNLRQEERDLEGKH